MPVIIDYILKLSICIAVVYLFYQLLLRRLTFHNWNRWYLLGYSVLSFIIPLVDIMPELQKKELDQNALVQLIPVFGFSSAATDPSFFESLTTWDWIMIVAGLGSVVLLARFLILFCSFLRIKRKAQLISEDRTRIYQLDEEIRPFSFGNAIFINAGLHSGEELEEIIRHEFVHVKQKHTLDIIWSEFLCILLWFNPFVWLLRKNIKQNLEFLADKQVLQNGMDKKEYQYLLLKVMGNKQFTFTNHFNFSSLKNRIAMMNTIKSAKVHLAKFLFLLPVIAVLLLSFRNEVKNVLHPDKQAGAINKKDDVGPATREKIGPSIADSVPQKNAELKLKITNTPNKRGRKNITNISLQNEVAGRNPLIIVDGVVQGNSNEALKELDRDDIQRVSVLKNSAWTSAYGDKGKDGVIEITTKAGAAAKEKAADATKVLLQGKVSGVMVPSANTIAGNTVGPSKEAAPAVTIASGQDFSNTKPGVVLSNVVRPTPLYVVNGTIASVNTFKEMDPNNIESISVLKDASSRALYGDAGRNGVVLITTKTGSKSVKGKAMLQEVIVTGYGSKEKEAKPAAAPEKQHLKLEPVEVKEYRKEAGKDDKTAPADTKNEKPTTLNFIPAKTYKLNLVYAATVKPEKEAVAKNEAPAETIIFKTADGKLAAKTEDWTIVADTFHIKKK